MRTFSLANRLIVVLLFSLALNIGLQLVQSTQESDGVCARFNKPELCPINCFRPDPVCGVDGVTYWCGCPDALCAGVKVAKLGFCEVGSGGSAPLPGQALLLVHIVWLFLLALSLLLGVF
ncbi:hypothetical protein WN944_017297 [Citrus x changshan-huyou]|uniref:Serine protease inhibitor, Kazal-type family protein n=1 Tax=Citrus x changshan-huyou TaxID=2935761 RepID=A0AAP0MB30_9ROSI